MTMKQQPYEFETLPHTLLMCKLFNYLAMSVVIMLWCLWSQNCRLVASSHVFAELVKNILPIF